MSALLSTAVLSGFVGLRALRAGHEAFRRDSDTSSPSTGGGQQRSTRRGSSTPAREIPLDDGWSDSDTVLVVEDPAIVLATPTEASRGTIAYKPDEWVLVYTPTVAQHGQTVTRTVYGASKGPTEDTVYLPYDIYLLYQDVAFYGGTNDHTRLYTWWWHYAGCQLPGVQRMPGAARHHGANWCKKLGVPIEPQKLATWSAKEAAQGMGMHIITPAAAIVGGIL